MSMTFSQWLSHSADAEFESFVRTRRDLLRPESPTIGALAAAASSRIGVSRGIEALDADELEVLISLATAALTADAELASVRRPRRALLRPESPTLGALAAAASSRIGVSRGIEALDADELEVLISLATAARTTSEIAVGENPHIDPARAEAA